MNRLIIQGIAVLVLVGFPVDAWSQAQKADFPDSAAAGSAVVDTASADDIAQRIRPGDLIRLRIWREPDLSGDYPVDERGVAVFPKIGPFELTSETPFTLQELLLREYRRYLRNPSIDVTLLRRINILGAVRNPGLHPVDPTMTIADALALAGGNAPYGDPQKVQLVREGEQITTRITQSTRIADLPIRSGDQLYVPEKSWFSRNSGIVATALTAAVSLVIAVIDIKHN